MGFHDDYCFNVMLLQIYIFFYSYKKKNKEVYILEKKMG